MGFWHNFLIVNECHAYINSVHDRNLDATSHRLGVCHLLAQIIQNVSVPVNGSTLGS